MRIKIGLLICILLPLMHGMAQAPVSVTSAELYLQIKKLKVLGAVLYVAAHPDDENTRLLAYLSKERLYRTGYLSITRGDGGQNLIGDEQGIDLGLIRTQELMAARRIDGAEQFFTRAYDFGFSKSTAEAFAIWNKEKVLSDVVWVIRKFQPDIIITRFPEDERAGHGHHSGSGVLAHEAFLAAADPARFPEQLKYGVQPWKAKRIFWNTFNFGNTNTTSESQMKIDVGVYNPILGKSYGEIAAESRSQHKSQGFGVPASRGIQLEYFSHVAGEPSSQDLNDGIDMTWKRVEGGELIDAMINDILSRYQLTNPETAVPALVELYNNISRLKENPWKIHKLQELQKIIEGCSGLWLEAYAGNAYAVQGDSIRLFVTVNNRSGASVRMEQISIPGFDTTIAHSLDRNRNYTFNKLLPVAANYPVSQPYWLQYKMEEGSFTVNDQHLIGRPDNIPAYQANFVVNISNQLFTFTKPVRYKHTDPVKGELYEPLVVVPGVTVTTEPSVMIFRKTEKQASEVMIRLYANRNFNNYTASVSRRLTADNKTQSAPFNLQKGNGKNWTFTIDNMMMKNKSQDLMQAFAEVKKDTVEQPAYLALNAIKYDHIPGIHYFYQDVVKVLNIDLKTAGKKVGYIEGAGDKVVIALEQMGYDVTILKEKDITPAMLRSFDAIITGVRAYNVNPFLLEKYDILMEYVHGGGNLIVQYNTNSQIGPVRTRIGPFPFNISRGRVTDERSAVKFLLPEHPVLNYPNKITTSDFEGWVQERGIYFADQLDPAFQAPLGMADQGEQELKGSLIITDHGKGKFVYTGLVFFRELPAGVPGAYRLLANIIALNKKKPF
jgi:LmbE family N-acetylglucosaminyl deacetylase